MGLHIFAGLGAKHRNPANPSSLKEALLNKSLLLCNVTSTITRHHVAWIEHSEIQVSAC